MWIGGSKWLERQMGGYESMCTYSLICTHAYLKMCGWHIWGNGKPMFIFLGLWWIDIAQHVPHACKKVGDAGHVGFTKHGEKETLLEIHRFQWEDQNLETSDGISYGLWHFLRFTKDINGRMVFLMLSCLHLGLLVDMVQKLLAASANWPGHEKDMKFL